MDKKKKIEKIKKLLKLSESSNQHEAALALGRAQALMKELGLTSESPQLSDVQEESIFSAIKSKTPASYIVGLISTIASAFGCHPHISRHLTLGRINVVFTGHNERPELAAYTYDVLERQLMKARKAFLSTLNKRNKQSTKTARADVFCNAWVYAVHDKVTAFALTEDESRQIEIYRQEQHPDLVTTKGREVSNKHLRGGQDAAAMAGYLSGKDAHLHQGMHGQEQTKLEHNGG
ncbi:DUF2786 domain-containing protein [Vibrio sp. YMD68]|uniref:DUF7168 domain-containing protein n=1 Tax=Vibrio sp. YMD68 TaxID=3042300 RepID=UPI00249A6DED|nr:DUF2786 domain-containing protein [Vibrio sp. YMD68]WGV98845.1 DUF2786 domain-containing protein [Vibrio sp. YMD68]WGW01228.1 DUF2786 domain-containing protein [Vibrio sp. YMD68]